MKSSNFEIEGTTTAIYNMDNMVKFYAKAFKIQFKELKKNNAKMYLGTWGNLKLLFCPAEVAGIKAKQNHHQFDVVVPALDAAVQTALSEGGQTMGESVIEGGDSTMILIMEHRQ